jgi:hypothetical protein
MSLKDIFIEEAATAAAKQDRDITFLETEVLPVVNQIADKINKDPDIMATYKPGGDDGGYIHRKDGSYYWAVEFTFIGKDDETLGKSTLYLAGNYPRVAQFGRDSIHLKNDANIDKAIAQLARNAAKAQGELDTKKAVNDKIRQAL